MPRVNAGHSGYRFSSKYLKNCHKYTGKPFGIKKDSARRRARRIVDLPRNPAMEQAFREAMQ